MISHAHRIKSQKWFVKSTNPENAILLRNKVNTDWRQAFNDALEEICYKFNIPENEMLHIPGLQLNLHLAGSGFENEEIKELFSLELQKSFDRIMHEIPGNSNLEKHALKKIEPAQILIRYLQTGILNWAVNNDSLSARKELLTDIFKENLNDIRQLIRNSSATPEFFFRLLLLLNDSGLSSDDGVTKNLFLFPSGEESPEFYEIQMEFFRLWEKSKSSLPSMLLFAQWLSCVSSKPQYQSGSAYITEFFNIVLRKSNLTEVGILSNLKTGFRKELFGEYFNQKIFEIPLQPEPAQYFEEININPGLNLNESDPETSDEFSDEKNNELKKEILEQRGSEEETESVWIQNAGIILLHPFFRILFEACGVLEKESYDISGFQKPVAVALLNYIVRGEDDINEFDLPLIKILCGLEIDSPVFTQSYHLSEDQKNECDALISGAIKHWDVLKSTGIIAFRTSFLFRNALLKKYENQWTLLVERQAHDVLLDRIPWPVSIIKTNWMKQMVVCKW